MAYYRAMGRGLFEGAEHMKYIELRSITKPVAIEANKHWGSLFEDIAKNQQLLMFGWSGMYWLVPHEIMEECVTTIQQQKGDEGTFNALPPVTITLEQCIPIPGETAKILVGL